MATGLQINFPNSGPNKSLEILSSTENALFKNAVERTYGIHKYICANDPIESDQEKYKKEYDRMFLGGKTKTNEPLVSIGNMILGHGTDTEKLSKIESFENFKAERNEIMLILETLIQQLEDANRQEFQLLEK